MKSWRNCLLLDPLPRASFPQVEGCHAGVTMMGKEPRLQGGPDTRCSPACHCEAPAGEAEPTAPEQRSGAKGEVHPEGGLCRG